MLEISFLLNLNLKREKNQIFFFFFVIVKEVSMRTGKTFLEKKNNSLKKPLSICLFLLSKSQ